MLKKQLTKAFKIITKNLPLLSLYKRDKVSERKINGLHIWVDGELKTQVNDEDLSCLLKERFITTRRHFFAQGPRLGVAATNLPPCNEQLQETHFIRHVRFVNKVEGTSTREYCVHMLVPRIFPES